MSGVNNLGEAQVRDFIYDFSFLEFRNFED
jgi:hypothetical protein